MSEPVSETSIDLGERVRDRHDDLRIDNAMKDASASWSIRLMITWVYLAVITLFALASLFLIIWNPTNQHATIMINIMFFVIGSGIENIRQRILEPGRNSA